MNIKINKSLIKYFSKLLLALTVVTVTLASTPTRAYAYDNTLPLNVHVFYSETCPHCADEEIFLKKLEAKYSNIKVTRYEITKNRDNLNLFIEVGKELKDNSGRVPFLVVGSEYVVGYLDEETHGAQIEYLIKKALQDNPDDLVTKVISKQTPEAKSNDKSAIEKPKFLMNIPFIGKTDINSLTLPVMTVVIGLLDGLNPCALWVLLFLISMLIGSNDRKKMWILAGTFILTSAVVYYAFMAAWLNFFLLVGYAPLLRTLIGIVALGFGVYYLYHFYKTSQTGCETTGEEKRQKMFDRIKKILETNSILLSVVGIAVLAAGINVVELLCSIGLPAIYTRALTLAHLPMWRYYLYLAGYVFFFILQDLIVFAVAMITFETIGIKQKYAKYSHLIGGLIILLLGLAMIFKPELLTFN